MNWSWGTTLSRDMIAPASGGCSRPSFWDSLNAGRGARCEAKPTGGGGGGDATHAGRPTRSPVGIDYHSQNEVLSLVSVACRRSESSSQIKRLEHPPAACGTLVLRDVEMQYDRERGLVHRFNHDPTVVEEMAVNCSVLAFKGREICPELTSTLTQEYHRCLCVRPRFLPR